MGPSPGDDGDRSAPGQVEKLEPLWELLPEERCRQLAFKWIDMSIRRMLADCFARGGRPHQAEVLRALAPIHDMESRREAEKVLGGLQVPDQPLELLAAFFNTLAMLEKVDDSMDLFECCFLAVMTSRLAYGDDRSLEEMRRDLLTAAV